ncbi:hypothetical protein ACFLRW_00340 [Acidobacteriota bacterium]
MDHVEKIKVGDDIYAIILKKEYNKPGSVYVTPVEFPQQLGMLIHSKGKIVKRHQHKLIKRKRFRAQEVLVILDGKIRVDLYDNKIELLKSAFLSSGDTILLAEGGHRVEILEDAKIINLKQGPHIGFDDKEFF